jgi:dipeptidyl aminopeptidase/acylaminoacyl peptidase
VGWFPDSRRVLFIAEDRGRVLPYQVSVDGGESQPLFATDAEIGAPSIAANDRLAFTLTSTTKPAEVAVLDAGATSPHVLTRLNAPVLGTLPVRDAQTIWFQSTENTPIQGWLITPAGAAADKPVPLLLSIHGGPHGAFGYTFSPEYQMFASRGYAVLYINPRGSSAYGQRFSDACIGNWGGVDYEDLMMGVDHVLATHPEIDPDHMFVTGGSYGGFMTNWVVTHTGRFRAAVTREGMSNLMTDQALSDAWDLEFIEFGPPWLNTEEYLRWSPIHYINHAVTPTMIIQGERDHDVTFAEAGQMYSGLRLNGVQAELVVYPREPHGFSEPQHIVDAYDRMWQWFESHRAGTQHMDQSWDHDRDVHQYESGAPGPAVPKT